VDLARSAAAAAEGHVAGLVAVPVVELLEVVDVAKTSDAPACPLRAAR
jgi:hypothetical protein